jgi:hypothetical protein
LLHGGKDEGIKAFTMVKSNTVCRHEFVGFEMVIVMVKPTGRDGFGYFGFKADLMNEGAWVSLSRQREEWS